METQNKDLEILWTIEQVAAYFTLSKRTVYQWIAQKRVIRPENIVRIGNRVRIPRSEVARIANEKKGELIKKTPPKEVAPVATPAAPVAATPIT